MFAGIDSLIPLIIFIGIAVISALMKKKSEQEEEPGGPVPGPRKKTWEEEIRDLMANRTPPPPPPVPSTQAPPPLKRPVVFSPPPIIRERIPAESPVEPTLHRMHGLSEADQRYTQATTLEQRVMQHMFDSTHAAPVIQTAHRAQQSPVASDVKSMLRNRKSLRAAIVASVILGPPKALQQD